MDVKVRLEVIRKFNELESFRVQWNGLLATRNEKPLPLTHEWMIAWWKSFGENRQLCIFCIYDADHLVAIAPFMKDLANYRGVSVSMLRLMANGHSPFCDIIVDGNADRKKVSQIVELLIKANTGNIMVFAMIPETSWTYVGLIETLKASGRCYGIKESLVTPILQIEGRWKDYFRSRSRKFRKSINNKLNRFAKESDFDIEKVIVSSRRLPVLDEVLQVSMRSWKAGINNDLGSNPGGWEFLLGLVDAYGESNAVYVWILRKAGVPIAYEFHIIFDDVVYPLRADFDESYRNFSPGSVLEYSAIKELFEKHEVSQYDSCADNYWYLNNWTDDVRKYFNIEIFSIGFKAYMLHTIEYRAIPVLRRIREKLKHLL